MIPMDIGSKLLNAVALILVTNEKTKNHTSFFSLSQSRVRNDWVATASSGVYISVEQEHDYRRSLASMSSSCAIRRELEKNDRRGEAGNQIMGHPHCQWVVVLVGGSYCCPLGVGPTLSCVSLTGESIRIGVGNVSLPTVCCTAISFCRCHSPRNCHSTFGDSVSVQLATSRVVFPMAKWNNPHSNESTRDVILVPRVFPRQGA